MGVYLLCNQHTCTTYTNSSNIDILPANTCIMYYRYIECTVTV